MQKASADVTPKPRQPGQLPEDQSTERRPMVDTQFESEIERRFQKLGPIAHVLLCATEPLWN